MTKDRSKTPDKIAVQNPLKVMVMDMLLTIDGLGRDPMARIDARAWAKHYRRRAKKLGVIK